MRILRKVLPIGLLMTTPALGDEPRPAIAIRLEGPDRQARAVIDLFRGARAPHPAAALASWKRASLEPGRLGKPLEALIASINPAMAGELRALDGAELALWADPEGGRPAWGACLPADDGTFAALATAFVLSGGAAEGPMGGLAVDRLGPPGSALMARAPDGLLVAGSAEGLKEARARSGRPRPRGAGDRLRFEVDPRALDGSGSPALRRARAALGAARGPIAGSTGLEGPRLVASLDVGAARPGVAPGIDPGWLEWLPADRAALAFALAVDPAPSGWDAAFRLADLVEKADPAREGVAPLRLRVDLIARAMGVRLDGEVLPHLRGVVGWAGSDGAAIDRAFVMLHLDGEAAALRIFERARPLPDDPGPPGPGAGRRLGQVGGRPLRLSRFGPAVVATWGDGAVEASLGARDRPGGSARPLFAGPSIEPGAGFLGAAWPARLPGLLPPGTPLAAAIAGAPPVLWSGAWKGPGLFRLEATWGGLDATIRRFLDLVPLDPPPDR